jgi:FkbM family methyltransferase
MMFLLTLALNIGSLTILGSTLVGNGGKVFSFEPHPKIYAYLCKNVEINKLENVSTYNIGLGEKKDKLFFGNITSDDQNSILLNNPGSDSIQVEVNRLDHVLDNGLEIRFLKIDVEGFELFVLNGAEGLLRKTSIIYFEASLESYQTFSYQLKDIIQFLNGLNISVYLMKDNHAIKIDENYILTSRENLLAFNNVILQDEIFSN